MVELGYQQWFLLVLTYFSAGLDLWICHLWGSQIAQAIAARESTLCTLMRSHYLIYMRLGSRKRQGVSSAGRS
jgi:hypothetical protein